MTTTEPKTLDDLKAGDRVLRCSYGRPETHTVDRVTKTLIIIGAERFKKHNGRRSGDKGYRNPTIEVYDEDILRNYDERKRIHTHQETCRKVDWFGVRDPKVLESVVGLVAAHKSLRKSDKLVYLTKVLEYVQVEYDRIVAEVNSESD